jgi:hypothetical protein
VDIGANIQLEAAVLAAGGIVSAYPDPSVRSRRRDRRCC